MSALPEDHRCSKYADYLFENYETFHSLQKCGLKSAESFHAHFNAQFVFLEILVKLQATAYVKMRGTNVVALYKERERN